MSNENNITKSNILYDFALVALPVTICKVMTFVTIVLCYMICGLISTTGLNITLDIRIVGIAVIIISMVLHTYEAYKQSKKIAIRCNTLKNTIYFFLLNMIVEMIPITLYLTQHNLDYNKPYYMLLSMLVGIIDLAKGIFNIETHSFVMIYSIISIYRVLVLCKFIRDEKKKI